MKNLFKNLMLVAVAAMAFTACQNDNNEVNEVNRVTRYEFTANIADDTRSGFAEKEEGATAYKSEWFGDETLKLFVTDYGTYNVETTATINKEGQFTLELTDAPESFFMTVVSPAESWSSQYSCTIPTEQTPLANSVDPKAHVLQSQTISIQTGSESISMSPQNACYGKMTVNGVDFEINKVEVSFNGGKVYTINATNVEDNVFWFAIDSPIEVSTFTVTAYGDGDSVVTKTVDVAAAEKTLKFQWGRVSTFSVSGLEVPTVPEEPEEPKALVFTSAKWVNTSYSDKLVQFYTEDGGTLQLNWYNCGSDAWIVPNTYGFASSGAIFYGGQYSWYKNTTAGINAEISNGTVVVSVVDGKYHIEFTNLADWDGNVYIESATFTGLISGLQVPDMRTALPKPTNVQVSVKGRVITTTWDAVEGADGYLFELCAPYDEKFTEIVEGTSFSFTGLNSLYYYYFKLSAYASDTNPNFRNSEEIYLEIKTEDTDPKMEVSESKLAFAADGGVKTFNVTLKNFDAEITYTQEGDWFSVDMSSGGEFTVTAEANESETEARNGSITVTAGDFSGTVTLTQSKKPAASTGSADGKTLETAYKFTDFKVGSDGGYPVLVFYGAEDGRVVAFEPSGSLQNCTGQKKLTGDCWWPHYMFYYESYNESSYDSATKLNILLDSSYSWIEKTSGGFTLEYFYIVSNGEGIYYTYDGVFNC